MSILVARLLENSDGQQENDYDNYEKHRHNNQEGYPLAEMRKMDSISPPPYRPPSLDSSLPPQPQPRRPRATTAAEDAVSPYPFSPPQASTSGSANIRLNGQDPVDQAECGGQCPAASRRRRLYHLSSSASGGVGGDSSGSGCLNSPGKRAENRSENGDGGGLRARKSNNLLVRLLLRFTRKQEEEKKKDITLDMLQPSRYKPNDLEQMVEDTKFSKREVRHLYRAFKQECPNGIVDEETFKEVYDKIFPLGDSSHYAHLVFLSIDRDRTGGITFGDFMDFLSVICKGSEEDKLLWAFEFYDTNRDGVISREEMLKVTDSIHELMGGGTSVSSEEAHARVEQVFESMDTNCDGMVSLDEFLNYCNSREDVKRSMMVLP